MLIRQSIPRQHLCALDNPEALQFIGERLGHQDRISIIPEFAAQITSYIKSTRAQRDLHFLVDVGAGTLDVTTFNAHKEGYEDIFPIFAAKVAPLGSRYYVAQLLSGIQCQAAWDEEGSSGNINHFAQSAGLCNKEMELKTSQFRGKVADIILNVLHTTKEERYFYSPRWEEGIPTFLCGGGSSIPLYQTVLKENRLLRLTSLEKPDTLVAESMGPTDFHRLSVACGLSFPKPDIGPVRPRSKVDPARRIPPEDRGCPGCGAVGTCYCG
ncbi:MAG: hypothetical protein IPL59_16330 [Candidatus Competibacteraceae bacterium]|nr:hypothetical protein [Candidatus Competibacteraceae bacterium]